VDAVAALRIGRCGIRADTMWDGRPARGDGVVVAAEATWEKRMMLDDLNVLYPAAERGWNRLAQRELQVCAGELAASVSQFTRRDGSIEVEGDVYRKTNGEDEIRYVKAEFLALPEIGGEPVDFVDSFLTQETRTVLEPVERLFGATVQSQESVKPVFRVRDEDYASLCLTLRERHMVEFVTEEPDIINGLFGVPKGAAADPLTRMITDSRPGNEKTIPLPQVQLPNPSTLLRLPKWLTHAAALDIHSFYNCLKIPWSWRRKFGLPRIRGQRVGMVEEWVWPVNTTLPMGWTGSVLLGQEVHQELFKRCVGLLEQKFQDVVFVDVRDEERMTWARENPSARVVVVCIYIDDLNLFGAEPALLDDLLRFFITEYRRAGFPIKDSKTTWATQALRVLGVWVDLLGKRVTPMPKTLAFLFNRLPRLARTRRRVDRWALESVLGRLTWICLLRRPLLAGLGEVYKFVDTLIRKGEAKVWPEVRRELLGMWGLLPLIQAKLVEDGELVVASDATGSDQTGQAGVGVSYTRKFRLGRVLETPWEELRDKWAEQPWQVAVQSSFKSTCHVNLHEAVGLILAGRAALSHGANGRDARQIILVDNTVVVGAATKGRSSSSGLNALLRRWAGFLLSQGWATPKLRYIPTDLNPADGPSRAYRVHRRQEA
jgi:hypothetical protein